MLEAFGVSDPGCVRANNEDYFITDQASGIFILADGMGGAQAGEHASRISADFLHSFLRSIAGKNGLSKLELGFVEANRAVRTVAREHPEMDGMGTTLLAAIEVAPDQMQVASVGDSRAYLVSGGKVSLVTRDQTWVAEVGSKLGLSAQALKMHPMRHVLTMAIGSGEDLRVDTQVFSFTLGDQLLLCSDGLHGVVDEQFLIETLLCEKSLDEKCHYLIEAARAKGGPDNVTVVLIQFV
jgi:serine/threonine protein phosphatase PrpC